MRAITRLAGVALATMTSVGVAAGTASAAGPSDPVVTSDGVAAGAPQAGQPGSPVVVGRVRLSDRGDHVRLRFSCSGPTYVHVLVRQGDRAMMTGRYPEPLACTGGVRTQRFLLENLPTGTPGLQAGPATATISLYEGPFGAPYAVAEQPVQVVDARQ